MGKVLMLLFCCFVLVSQSEAQLDYETNIFVVEEQEVVFEYESEMIDFLKAKKPTAFKFYNRLNKSKQREVFVLHLQGGQQLLTDIVMTVYKSTKS